MAVEKTKETTFHESIFFGKWLLVETADGSPSLQNLTHERHELMHHRGGAFAESTYIYDPALRWAFEATPCPQVISLGLGLGYNEILLAALSIEKQQGCRLTSFEADESLLNSFLEFAAGRETSLSPQYHKICSLRGLATGEIAEFIATQIVTGHWDFRGTLSNSSQLPQGIHCYLWDAFSRKTSESLWTEEFLDAALAKAATLAALSTYASVGTLKRALKKAGFLLQDRPGFQGKRNSTFAIKNLNQADIATEISKGH